MKRLAAGLLCALLLSAARLGAEEEASHLPFAWQDLLPRALQSHPRVELTVITEDTPEGRKLTPASASHPAYYLGRDSGLTEAGDAIAGERPPPAPALAAKMQKALAINGYLAADPAHPPALFLSYRWGSFNKIRQSLSADGSEDELQKMNLVERAAIVGGDRFALTVARAIQSGTLEMLRTKNPRFGRLLDQSRDDLYFVIVSAFDYAAAQQGRQVLLWRTKISTSSQGLEMDETVPVLVAAGGTCFGQEMTEARPVELRIGEGKVTIGEPTVKGYFPSDYGRRR